MLLLELFELVYVRVREVLPDLRLAPIAEALEVPLVGAVHLRHDSRDGWLLPLAARAGRVVLLDEVVETEALHVLLEPLSDQVGALEVVLVSRVFRLALVEVELVGCGRYRKASRAM